ncbi:MAG: single-stranded DNA-binding protein [Chloroflexota bacterium]|uniref:Single-stranded DNA-binding protein n=1 Tax=marine metagenome TaxID=408172 RepID=A0A381YHC3_9ZZZZ|nr:single-stranded DNA-binding protein [Chloroflexota bacterium]MBV46009.1 single-stranded DNA-binding protein [Dehalococcoidia bacterium]MEC7913059.1 single-stranded DNA-binding protein [Chloroflexota bacterium]HAT22616.1 single-stranded DNA-binding protein [Dehalococcoidia bacterium]HBF00742.1 single-stranded DNA-binding protein [Dehalococcoidia bacterium]
MTMNKILIIGNLGSDPEMRYTPNGNPVTSFTVATNRRYRASDGENREETEWFRISAWNRLAETCNQYLQRGSKVYVEGRLSSRTYVGNDGETRVSLDVNASEVRFIDSRGANTSSSGGFSEGGSNPDSTGSSSSAASIEDEGEIEDDLPW